MANQKNILSLSNESREDLIRQATVAAVIICIIGMFEIGIEIFAAPLTTDELMEADWNEQTYGPPEITLSLPKELKPQVPRIPDEMWRYVSELESYHFTEKESYNFSLTCAEYIPLIKISLEGAANGGIEEIKNTKGISNVKFSETPYTLGKMKGIMQHGSLQENEEAMEFTVLYLTRKSSMWQIIFIHPWGDANGRKVSERILKSLKV
jgi:hypothetical protein